MGSGFRRARLCALAAVAVVGTAVSVAIPQAEAAFSGVNGEIAFIVDGRVATRNVDGSNRKFLTTPPQGSRDDGVAWSPAGDRIAFLRTAAGKGDIWIANADGSSPTKVTSSPNGGSVLSRPAWSPDGSEIAYAVGSGTRPPIHIIKTDGSGDRELTKSGGFDLAWSPAGHLIAFTEPDLIMALSPELGGGHSLGLTKGTSLDWTTDGMSLGFIGTDKKIHVAEYEDSGTEQTLNFVTNGGGFGFSPEGAHVVFGCTSTKAGGATENHICVGKTDGSQLDDITSTVSPGSESQPAWRPVGGGARFTVSKREPRPGDTVTLASTTPCSEGATSVSVRLIDADGAARAATVPVSNGAWTASFEVPPFARAGYNFFSAWCSKGSTLVGPFYNPQYTRVLPPPFARALITAGQGDGGTGRITTVGVPSSFVPKGTTTFGPNYSGPVSVARGNVDPDSPGDEFVVGSGPTWYPTQVAVLNQNGQLLRSVKPFGETFAGGAFVAIGDVSGDGALEVVVGAGEGGGPHIKTFSGNLTPTGPGFFAFDRSFIGGVRVATGRLTDAAKDAIVVGAGPGGGPHVRTFLADGAAVDNGGFFAYGANFAGGVWVAAGDLRSGGAEEILTGAGAGGAPHVRIFNANGTVADNGFYAYGSNFPGGVTVATGQLDGIAGDEIVTGAGPGGAPHVRSFFSDGEAFDGFYAFEESFHGGVSVATGFYQPVVLP